MKGRSDSHVVNSHVCRSSVKAASTHSPECGFGCLGAQKPILFSRDFILKYYFNVNLIFRISYQSDYNSKHFLSLV